MANKIFNRQRSLYYLSITAGCALIFCVSAAAQTTAFNYQGRLTDGGTPANGNYDLQFALWDSSSGGSQIGSTQLISTVAVSSGVFAVTLDFGANAFPGANRFLEISARVSGASAFILLSPRQQITSTPYAVRSGNATIADTATNATQLGGVSASQYVQTNDARLTDSRSPTAGSSNYIQNTTSTQSASNFNISGGGTAGGMLSGNVVSATTQYNLNGSRVLSTGPGVALNDLLVGASSGVALTSGAENSFFGVGAGNSTTTGAGNSFFGFRAGSSNTTPNNNSFFGDSAGYDNTTGSDNSFFGVFVGFSNTTGSNNSFFGIAAGAGNTTGGDNSFFGAEAGNANSTAGFNSFFGSLAGRATKTGTFNSFFGARAGFSNTVANSNSFFGASAGVANTTGDSNSFFGSNAGGANVTGTDNSIFGAAAGQFTTSIFNSFFGSFAGEVNTTGAANAFFGAHAGLANTTGANNAFFGFDVALGNTTGDSNAFFGAYAGQANTAGTSNSFFGRSAGFNSSANNNAFFGTGAGQVNTTGDNNTFMGFHAGEANSTGASNVVIGARANVGASSLTNASAVGALAQVNCSSCLVLGSINGVNGATTDTFVGIGTTTPGAKLHVSGGAILLDNNQGLNLKSNFGAPKRVLLADTSNRLHIGSGGGFGFDEIRFDLGTPGTVMTMLSSGNIGIGTIAPDQLLSVNGNASKVGGGSWQVFSDERLKNIKGQFKAGLQTLRQLQPLRYEYKPNNALGLRGEGEYVGFSAQAVQRVLPEAVNRTASGYLQINNDPILWTMLNAIKEQQQEIEQLKSQLHRFRGAARGRKSNSLRKAAARGLRKQ